MGNPAEKRAEHPTRKDEKSRGLHQALNAVGITTQLPKLVTVLTVACRPMIVPISTKP